MDHGRLNEIQHATIEALLEEDYQKASVLVLQEISMQLDGIRKALGDLIYEIERRV